VWRKAGSRRVAKPYIIEFHFPVEEVYLDISGKDKKSRSYRLKRIYFLNIGDFAPVYRMVSHIRADVEYHAVRVEKPVKVLKYILFIESGV
jgi:hypothetical protein